jgi:CubicO group peptidase (beta-lactamase class C family)
MPSTAEIQKIINQRVDDFHQSVGIVVGILTPEGRTIIAHGPLAKGDTRQMNGDTVFEIGSVSKVFTSLLLADMVQRKEVALTDPVAKYLPDTVKVPQRGGKQITLVDLATHTSGLPRMPNNFKPADPSNPYADYTVAQMYEFLSGYQLTRDIGEKYEYSNLGGGLLGHALARRAGVDYETLLHDRITGPLGMKDTAIKLSTGMQMRLATGYDAKLNRTSNWDIPTLAGAGGIRSTANDLLTFLAAFLGYTKTPLAPAMAAMLETRRPTDLPTMEIALGWHVATKNGPFIWHNGGTGGYRTFIGYDPKTRAGVVVLANAFTAAGVDDIGMHLLNPKAQLLPASTFAPPKERKEIKVDPALFDKYTGRYELAPNFILTVTREGDHLFTQATGQPKVEIFPETEKDFFLKVVDAQITFESDHLTLHQMGRNMPAKRLP